MVWVALILVIFGFGVQNISLAVTDYYNYDKITNIDRVTPQNVTFPAITVCSWGYFQKHYYRSELVTTSRVYPNSHNVSLIKNYIVNSVFPRTTEKHVRNHLDFFTIPRLNHDCVRFNAVTNKSVELFKASSSEDYFRVKFCNYFIQEINDNISEYYNYTFIGLLHVYIGNNHLNSFEKIQPLLLVTDSFHNVQIQKEYKETKLPPPFNPCQESSVGKPYHRWDCIDACVARETKNQFNCTFPTSLFAVHGFKRCENNKVIEDLMRFSQSCEKECPLENCFSEKFVFDMKSTIQTVGSGTTLQFSFRDLSTLSITQIPKTDVFTFINNIGGGLGLFMGIAFPNLIEFLQFVTEICLIAFGW